MFEERKDLSFYALLIAIALCCVQLIIAIYLEAPDYPVGRIRFSCTYDGCYSDYPDVVDNLTFAIFFVLLSLCFVRLEEHYFKAMSAALTLIAGYFLWFAVWHKTEMITKNYFVIPTSLLVIDAFILMALVFAVIKLIVRQFIVDDLADEATETEAL